MINQNWVFGKNARVNFATTPPTASPNNPATDNGTPGTHIRTQEGCASISDVNGNLILYTDGWYVWDGNNVNRTPVSSGGTFIKLEGDPSSTQSSIIVPNPGNAAQYYIFTTAGTSGGSHHVSGRRITTGTGLWVFENLSSIITPAMPTETGFSPTEKITAIRHHNGTDFWVVTIVQATSVQDTPANNAASGMGTLRVFLVDSTGVHCSPDQPMLVNVHDSGYLKGSRSGKRIAIANWFNHNVLVYDFDNANGTIAQMKNIAVPTNLGLANSPGYGAYGVEFSPNSDILYFTVLGGHSSGGTSTGYVFQHNLTSTIPNYVSVQVGSHVNEQTGDEVGRYALGALQLGMDNRIYIALDGEPRLGVIMQPDTVGPNCGVKFNDPPNTITLAQGSICYMGLPNQIPFKPAPCDAGSCDSAVDAANQILRDRASQKHNIIQANGQVEPTIKCRPAFEQAEFAPLFSLRWGDSQSDQFESHDTEIIYIQIRNPFTNLIYRGVKIFNIKINPNHVHPDGENALQLIPAEIACFDEIKPCSTVSRDFALLIQNAVAQSYQIAFDYCIDEIAICGSRLGSKEFTINVVAS